MFIRNSSLSTCDGNCEIIETEPLCHRCYPQCLPIDEPVESQLMDVMVSVGGEPCGVNDNVR